MGLAGEPVVLVVDEGPATRKLVRRILESAGLGCIEAADGESGLKIAARAGVSAAVVALALPGMSGAELAWRLREEMCGLPVVAVSGRLDLWDTDDLRDLGIQEALPLPFEPQRLLRAVADALRCPRELHQSGLRSGTGGAGRELPQRGRGTSRRVRDVSPSTAG